MHYIMFREIYHLFRKMFDVNAFDIAAKCLQMFGVSDFAEAMAIRNDLIRDNVLKAKCVLSVVTFSFYNLSLCIVCYRF